MSYFIHIQSSIMFFSTEDKNNIITKLAYPQEAKATSYVDSEHHFTRLDDLGSLNRGYYMAAQGYEFYLLVLKVSLTCSLHSLVRDNFSTRR